MSIYLDDIPLNKAKEILNNALISAGLNRILGIETIHVDENTIGRVLAKSIFARLSSPSYNSSAMDGFAVHSLDVANAKITDPVILNYGSETVYVDTGDPIPENFNAVVAIEDCEAIDELGVIAENQRKPDKVKIRSSMVPWNNVRFLGEDITYSQLLYVGGHEIRPVDLGVIASGGYSQIDVTRKPRVAILPTGSELVPLGTIPEVGQILEFNSLVLAAKVNLWGGIATRNPIIKDDKDLIFKALSKACEDYDLILINAGSSAGSEDFTSDIISKLGVVLVHGIAVRPGHPVIIGMLDLKDRKVPVIGIPGFPVSAALTMDLFVHDLINLWTGKDKDANEEISARLTRKITSPAGDDDYVRVTMAQVGKEVLASPLSRGAGVLSSLTEADGLIKIPSGNQGLEEGVGVNVTLLKKKEDIYKTILCLGSHDLVLEKLKIFLSSKDRRLISMNLGSLSGLLALNKSQSHLAGSHLLDGETGEYNLTYIKKYLNMVEPLVIALAMREQGLMVRKGNPKNIQNLEDLMRDDVNFINRQRGSGTRILLDFHLKKKRISSDKINGYDLAEFTHLGIASAVISGRADCGLGIAAASIIYDLEFIPLFEERYDLVFNKQFNDQLLEPLIAALTDQSFKDSLNDLIGYKFQVMGEVILG
jgi:putative molybdopterin biosynthesis protein